MDFYDGDASLAPASVGDGKVCNIVKTAINCSGGTTQTQCQNVICVQANCSS